MPKSLRIDPANERRVSVIRAPEIPVNAYVSLAPKPRPLLYSREQLVNVYHDMLLIREFETALDGFKKDRRLSRHPLQLTRGRRICRLGRKRPPSGSAFTLSRKTTSSARIAATARFLAKGLSAIRRAQ